MRTAAFLSVSLLACLLLSSAVAAQFRPVGSRHCPASLQFPPVIIKELRVDWEGRSQSLRDVLTYAYDTVETGQMDVVFWDLDARYPFRHYLVIATPDSELAGDEEIAEVQSVTARTPDAEGLITHHLDLEPGYEYGVEVYAVSIDHVTRLSAKPDTRYATTLLSPLYFGGYQLDVTYACTADDVNVLRTEGCRIEPHTALITTSSGLPFATGSHNSHVLAMTAEPDTAATPARTIRFLDPASFGPADHVRSDRAGKATHYQLKVYDGDDPVYARRMALDDETFWVTSSNTYTLWHPQWPANTPVPQPMDRAGNPLASPEYFKTAWEDTMQLADGTYTFELLVLSARKDDDADKVTYEVISAPSRMVAEVGGNPLNQYAEDQYRNLLQGFEEQLAPDSEELHFDYWAGVLYPRWKEENEYLLYAIDDLALILNATLQ